MAVRDTSNDHTIALHDRVKPCDRCTGPAAFSVHCGAWVCDRCDSHRGLARCFCGWSASGGNGRTELIEDGETIDGDDWDSANEMARVHYYAERRSKT